MIGEKWMKWTLLEAVSRTAAKTFQRIIGAVSTTFGHLFFVATIMGIMQTIVGVIVAKLRHKKLLADKKSVFGSLLFGVLASAGSVLCFLVFFYGGDVGIHTFIATLAIVPGALVDRIFFNHRLNYRQYLGILVAIFAGYSILGWPSLAEITLLPLWVWLSFGTPISMTINQGITQWIKDVDPFVKNFWGGLGTLFLGIVGLIIFNSLNSLVDFSESTHLLWVSALAMGIIIIAVWVFNLISYRDGASIAIKKLVLSGAFLTLAMTVGIVFFNESLTVAKISGFILYLIAFTLMDKNTWNYFSSKFRKK